MQDVETTPLAQARINDFALHSYEKLRYADTDRQGHVNNAVFASILETGRVELLYNPDRPLADEQRSFVIARLTLDLHAEITWPGRVDIGTRAARIGRSSITLEQALFQNGQRAATASTVIVHVSNTTRRSQALSAIARQTFASLL